MNTDGIHKAFQAGLAPQEPTPAPTSDVDVDADGSILPSPMQHLAASGDIGAQISALLLEIGHDQKKAARAAREAAEHAQLAAEERELDAMKEQADAKLAAGLVGAGAQLGSAAMRLEAVGAPDAKAQGLKAGADAVSAFGTIDKTILEYGADEAGRRSKRAGNAVSHQKSAVEDAREQAKDAKASIDKAIDLYKEYLTGKNEAARAAFLKA
jgi:hypothetical protein